MNASLLCKLSKTLASVILTFEGAGVYARVLHGTAETVAPPATC